MNVDFVTESAFSGDYEEYDPREDDDNGPRYFKNKKRIEHPSPKRRIYYDFNPTQIARVVNTKLTTGSAPLSIVLVGTFTADPKTDFKNDPQVAHYWPRERTPDVFLLGNIVHTTTNPHPSNSLYCHDRKVIIRLVRPNIVYDRQVQNALVTNLNEIVAFHQSKPEILKYFPEQEKVSANKTLYPPGVDTCFSIFKPFIDISSRTFCDDTELANMFQALNDKITQQLASSKRQDLKDLSAYPPITDWARLLPNVVKYKSSKGFGTRHYYTPKSIYGYMPDEEFDPFVYRVWISSKELLGTIVSVLEKFAFNSQFGTFRVFDDTTFDAQWKLTFGIKLNQVYQTAYYNPMNMDFKEYYFNKVGSTVLDPCYEQTQINRTTLFLDVDFDSFVPDTGKISADYSMEVLHFDMEAANQPMNPFVPVHLQKPRFCIPYVNATNLEKSITKKILQDSLQRDMDSFRDHLCPNCPKSWKGHEHCREAAAEDVEDIETEAYIKKLISVIGQDTELAQYATDCSAGTGRTPKASDWIPDRRTGVDEIISICFTVANIRDMTVAHPCSAYSHYILTHRPRNRSDWNLDYDLLAGSRRLSTSRVIIYNSELEMILGFAELIRLICPFKISGYNINGFDIPYLEDRMKWYGKFGTPNQRTAISQNPFNIGLMRYYFRPHKGRYVFRPNIGRRLMIATYPALILNLDVIEGVGNETFSQPGKMNSHKLNHVAAANLLYPGTKEPMLKIQLNVTDGVDMWKAGGSKAMNFFAYCTWDAILALGLARNFAFDELADTITTVTGTHPNLVYSTGVREKIMSLYHTYNRAFGKRYIIPVEKGGIMVLMHHPDIWRFSTSRCHDEYLDENPYKPHRSCPKTGLKFPHIYEVVERRKVDSWLKGAIRNFTKNDFTPNTPEAKEKYKYSDRTVWSTETDPAIRSLWSHEMEKPNGTPVLPKDPLEKIKEDKALFEKKIRDWQETVDDLAACLDLLKGEQAAVKYARMRANYDMKHAQAMLRQFKEKLKTTIIDENIIKARTAQQQGRRQYSTVLGRHKPTVRDSVLGNLDLTPKKIAETEKKQKAKEETAKTQPKNTSKSAKSSKKDEKKPYIGGKVLDMIRSYFEEFIVFGDFNSLYPSIMFSNYVDFSTLLTAYLRTSVYPNISPFKYKRVIVGPYKDIFSADYVYDPQAAKQFGYDTPELAETAWIQDGDCLTTIIMDDLLALRNVAKKEMGIHTAAICDLNFQKYLLSQEGKPLKSLLARLRDKKYQNEDNGVFGGFKDKFLERISLMEANGSLQDPDCVVSVVGPTGIHAQVTQTGTEIQIRIINHKNKERVYNIRQTGIKVVMNSGYGFMGSKQNLSLPEGAGTITGVGRIQIQMVTTIVENMSVIKVMARDCGLASYLLTLGLHPAAFHPELLRTFVNVWPTVEAHHLARRDETCNQQKGIGGDTDSSFNMINKTIMSIENMDDPVYPTVLRKLSEAELIKVKTETFLEVALCSPVLPNDILDLLNGAIVKLLMDGIFEVDKTKKPMTKYQMICKFADFQSLTIIQSFLPIEIMAKDRDYYDTFKEDHTNIKDILMYHLLNHPNLVKVPKQKMVVEKIADKFLGFGKKLYSYTNCIIKKLCHKGTTLVRGDGVLWVVKLMKKEFDILFETAKLKTKEEMMKKRVVNDDDSDDDGAVESEDEEELIQRVERLEKDKEPIIHRGEKLDPIATKIIRMFLRVIHALEELALGKNIVLSDFEISKRLKKDTSLYMADQPHVRVARKMIKRGDPNVGPQTNVRFVFYCRYGDDEDDEITTDEKKEIASKIMLSKAKSQAPKKQKETHRQTNLIDGYFKPTITTSQLDTIESMIQSGNEDISLMDMDDADIGIAIESLLSKKGSAISTPAVNLMTSNTVKLDADTASYVIKHRKQLNIPFYIENLILGSLGIILSPFISGNDKYPLVGDEIDKNKIAVIEKKQKAFRDKQRRAVEDLLMTPKLRTRLNKMNDWYLSKILLANGQACLSVTAWCIQCQSYWTYQNHKTPKKGSAIEEVCPKCKDAPQKTFKILGKKYRALARTERQFTKCLAKCEKCILRTEVGIVPNGLIKEGRWTKSKDELLDKLYESSADPDIEDLWKLASNLPKANQMLSAQRKLITLNDLTSLDNTGKSDVNVLYPPSIWINNPLECRYEDCKRHRRRRVLHLRYEQVLQSIPALESLLVLAGWPYSHSQMKTEIAHSLEEFCYCAEYEHIPFDTVRLIVTIWLDFEKSIF